MFMQVYGNVTFGAELVQTTDLRGRAVKLQRKWVLRTPPISKPTFLFFPSLGAKTSVRTERAQREDNNNGHLEALKLKGKNFILD